jgi:hypothetical protein
MSSHWQWIRSAGEEFCFMLKSEDIAALLLNERLALTVQQI